MSTMSSVERQKPGWWYTSSLGWNLFAAVATQGSTLVGNVLVARLVGVTDFGAFSLIQSTLVTASMVGQLGTGLTTSRFVAEFMQQDPQKAMRVAGMVHVVSFVAGIVFALALLLGADWLAGSVLGNRDLAGQLRVGSVYVVAATLSGTQVGTLAGLGDYGTIARAGIIAGAAYCIVIAALTWMAGLDGAVLAISLALVVRVAIQIGFLQLRLRERGLRLRFDGFLEERALLFRYTIPAALSGMTTMPAIWFANASLARAPDGLREMGLLSAALSYRNLVLFLPSVVDGVGAVRLARCLGARDYRGLRHAFRHNLALTLGIAFAVAAVLWLCADLLLALFGRGFVSAGPLFGLLLVSALLQVGATAVYQVVNMAGLLWVSFFLIALPRDVGFAVMATHLIPEHGAGGVGWAYVGAHAFGLAVTALVAIAILRRQYPVGRT